MGSEGKVTKEAQQKFGEQFLAPVQPELVGDLRKAFGLPLEGGADSFAALAIDAED